MPSFVAVSRSLWLDSLVYRPKASKTSSAVTEPLLVDSVLMSVAFYRCAILTQCLAGDAVVVCLTMTDACRVQSRRLSRYPNKSRYLDREATPPVTKGQLGQVPDDGSLSVPELSATATADGFESNRDSDIFKEQTSHCR